MRRVENGVDTATVMVADTDAEYYEDVIDEGDSVTIKEKDASDASWTTLLSGVVRVVRPEINLFGNTLRVECDGAGYGFMLTACGEEYGTESSNSSLDTIAEILTDATNGIIPKWVNSILGSATSSGYSYTFTVDTITGAINYVHFPYKPCYKAVQDLCDLVQAIKGTNAGPHWIVTTGSKFLLTTVANHSANVANEGWTTYYNGSQADATLEEGEDFIEYNFQKLSQ